MSTQGRDMRGASYMDQYDSNYGDDDYGTSKSSGDDDGCCTKCTKHILFAVNFVMLLIGVALIVAVFFLRENSSDDLPFGFNDTIVWITVACGSLIIIVSFLGCVGATTRSICLLSLFAALLIVCLILELVGIIIIFADKDLIRKNAQSQWDGLSVEQRQAFQLDNDCGCTDSTDCDSLTDGFDDCYSIIQDSLEKNMFIVGGITIGIFVYQLVMTIFAFCLIFKSRGKGGKGSFQEEV